MNDSSIKIGVTGRVLDGEYKDWFIFIEDNSANTGGCLILLFDHIDRLKSSQEYDYWAENKNSLTEMF